MDKCSCFQIIIKFVMLSSILHITSCSTDEEYYLIYGLTKPVKKITELTYKLDSESNRDSIKYVEKLFRKDNLMSKRYEQMFFEDEYIHIDFKYNSNDQIREERVKMKKGSFDISYFYNDTLLLETRTESVEEGYDFKMFSNYYYNKHNLLDRIIRESILANHEVGDTIKKITEIEYHNGKDLIQELVELDHLDSTKNHKLKYLFDRKDIMEVRKFNYQDSLISTTTFEYVYDEYYNWIQKKSFENDALSYIIERVLIYK